MEIRLLGQISKINGSTEGGHRDVDVGQKKKDVATNTLWKQLKEIIIRQTEDQ